MRKKPMREKLQRSLDMLDMKNADFGMFTAPVTLSTDAEVDAFVKERIRLYISSWVKPGIAWAIAEIDR